MTNLDRPAAPIDAPQQAGAAGLTDYNLLATTHALVIAERNRLTVERDRLKVALDNMAASRDQARAEIRRLTDVITGVLNQNDELADDNRSLRCRVDELQAALEDLEDARLSWEEETAEGLAQAADTTTTTE